MASHGRGAARPDIHLDGDDEGNGTWTPEGSDSGVVLVDATDGPVSARAAPPSGTKNCSWPLPVAMATCLFST